MTGMMCKIEQIACPRNVPNSHPFLTKLLLLFAKVWKASYWRLKTSLLIRAVHVGFTYWQYLFCVCFLGMLMSSDMGRNSQICHFMPSIAIKMYCHSCVFLLSKVNRLGLKGKNSMLKSQEMLFPSFSF